MSLTISLTGTEPKSGELNNWLSIDTRLREVTDPSTRLRPIPLTQTRVVAPLLTYPTHVTTRRGDVTVTPPPMRLKLTLSTYPLVSKSRLHIVKGIRINPLRGGGL